MRKLKLKVTFVVTFSSDSKLFEFDLIYHNNGRFQGLEIGTREKGFIGEGL